VIGVDVGGTTVKGLSLAADGTVLAERRATTPSPDPTGSGVLAAVAAVATSLGHRHGDPLGVALPGVVDEATGTAVQSANLGWRDLPALDLLRARLGDGVVLCHDVRAGAVAEAGSGAAQGIGGVAAFVPVGTGISAAVLVDGVPLVAGGWAGEIGQVVLADGPFAGLRVEEVASAPAATEPATLVRWPSPWPPVTLRRNGSGAKRSTCWARPSRSSSPRSRPRRSWSAAGSPSPETCS